VALDEVAYDAKAGAVLVAALGDPVPRVREEVHQLFESLGSRGTAILDELQHSNGSTEELESVEAFDSLSEQV
jgi:hypothetical protein